MQPNNADDESGMPHGENATVGHPQRRADISRRRRARQNPEATQDVDVELTVLPVSSQQPRRNVSESTSVVVNIRGNDNAENESTQTPGPNSSHQSPAQPGARPDAEQQPGGPEQGNDAAHRRISRQAAAREALENNADRQAIRAEYRTRTRLCVTSPPRIITSFVLDREFDISLFSCAALLNPRRWFCNRCSTAQQTSLVLQNFELMNTIPPKFCCEGFFNKFSSTQRSLFLCICLMDTLTCGAPCCLCYNGCGTGLFTWRLRYLVRLRYRVHGTVAVDWLTTLCCPGFDLEQQGQELNHHGLSEPPSLQVMN